MAETHEERTLIRRRLDTLRSVRTDLSGRIVDYADAGDGPPVLALHGGLGGCDQGMLLGIAAFADWPGRRILAPSRAGYLGTPAATASDFAEEADVFARLLDHLGIGAVDAVAVSGGGPSAIHFAVRHADRCRALILVSACTGRLVVPEEFRPQLERMQRLARFALFRGLMAVARRYAPDAAIRRSIPDAGLRRRTLDHPEAGLLIRALQRTTTSRLDARIPGLLKDIAADAAIGSLPIEAVTAPILVIHGDADRVVPFSHAEEVVRRAAKARLLRLAGADHVALFTHLDEVREATAMLTAGL